MERIDDNNPFESPTAASDPSVPLENALHRARLGWLLPVIGIGLFLLLMLTELFVISTSLNVLMLIGVLVCLAGGILFTIYGMFWSQSYGALRPHVLGGLAGNFVLMAIMGGVMVSLYFWIGSPPPMPG